MTHQCRDRAVKPSPSKAVMLCALMASASTQAYAQSDDEDVEFVIEDIVVTGSYLKRNQAAMSSPLTIIDQESLRRQAVSAPGDLVKNLTFNSGSEYNFDQSDQDRSVGTAQMNLRGLGLASTLTLVNGRRQTLSASSAQGGDTFVDINSLMPTIMVDRLEVLKDGASALYGTEAVAGVVNFITRKDFRGAEMLADYRFANNSNMRDIVIQGIVGFGNDETSLVAALSYLDRTPMDNCDRDFSCETQRTFSSLGSPGAFILTEPVTSGPFAGTPAGRIPDPDCPPELIAGTACSYTFSPNNQLIPEQQRLNAFAEFSHSTSENFELFGEFSFTRTETGAANSPSLPLLTPAVSPAIVPATHPANVFGVDAIYFGRPFADDGLAPGENRNINNFDDTTYRVMTGARGIIPGTADWTWELAYQYSANQRQYTLRDTVGSAFRLALQGLGGNGCNPLTGTPGEGPCEYFNPFGTRLTTMPNSDAIVDFITTDNFTEEETSLTTIDAVVTGEVAELPAGGLGLAIGLQYRDETREIDSSADAERQDLSLFAGGVDAMVARDVYAIFTEALVPIVDSDSFGYLEASFALRYEDYGSGLDTTDPKIALLYRPNDSLAFRASWGTSFRAPSLLQIGQEQIAVDAFFDPITRVFSFVAATANPNPDLRPETAEFLNFGGTWDVTSDFRVSVDYYNISYKDLLTADNTQAVISAEFAAYSATCADPATLTGCDTSALNSEQVIRNPATLTPQGLIRNRFNAASADTSGIDVALNYDLDTDSAGAFAFYADATYVIEYKLQATENGPIIDAVGSRNKLLQPLVRSMPQWRANVGATWSLNNHSAALDIRYIDSYYDDQNDADIGSFTTVDLQYSYRFPDLLGLSGTQLTVGASNLFDQDPPFVNSETGYDSKVHPPVGRLVFMRLVQSF